MTLIKSFIDFYFFFRYGSGVWNSTLRKKYNLEDATTRNSVQVNGQSSRELKIDFTKIALMNELDDAGISELLECNIGIYGQQRNVELKIWKLGKAVFRARTLHQSLEQRTKFVH